MLNSYLKAIKISRLDKFMVLLRHESGKNRGIVDPQQTE